ncbi:hypothetical protein PE066_06230 [Ramlibacter tataouinensis]|uniref:hypothetical protein n=1 Tax=Ramlibacter tataouinensis TaxID=94132 RepID=UPI0022F3BDA6|nr:hypothetical protein [Ramlibacter tataouinensis]WBY03129.1 hypothetical protein PE066_06230 [Ramlibacter tataouinensis]
MSSILILGASYGSLLATRLSMAGHNVCLVCTAPTAELINRDGTRARFPVEGRDQLVEVDSRKLPGTIAAAATGDAQPAGFDLAILAMQEPHYGEDGVRQLMERLARAAIPCLAVMNMPPPPYLRRIPGLQVDPLAPCFADLRLWDGFEPGLVSLASPDPQAFRPAGEPKNVLQVGLPTNFKCAPFESDTHTALLRRLSADIENARYEAQGESLQLPVKLKAHQSMFVPLAKWPMLMAGNYRCIGEDGIVPIANAVYDDPDRSRAIYNWVEDLCLALGAQRDDLVPFQKYAAAAASLKKPSSVARSLAAGAEKIERVDLLVQCISAQRGLSHPDVDAIVGRVNEALRHNRAAAGHLAV